MYDIHADDATMAKCLHGTNITSHIQGMIIQIKTCFWRSNNNGIGVTVEDAIYADSGPRLETMMANEKGGNYKDSTVRKLLKYIFRA